MIAKVMFATRSTLGSLRMLENTLSKPNQAVFTTTITRVSVASPGHPINRKVASHKSTMSLSEAGSIWSRSLGEGLEIVKTSGLKAAGADVLYAPGLRDVDSVRAVTSAVAKSINVVMGLPGTTPDVNELTAVGVERISLGSAFLRAVLEVRDEGRFSFASRAVGFAGVEAHFAPFQSRDQVRDGA